MYDVQEYALFMWCCH